MPANMELLSAITELLLKHYGKQGGAAANESAPPPPQSAPAAGGQGVLTRRTLAMGTVN